jgi:hypothetical protein
MGREFMKLGKYTPALKLFNTALDKATQYCNDVALYSCPLKQLYIQSLLDLAQCHLALGSPPNAKSVLNTLFASERSLSLDYNNPKFLEMTQLTVAIDHWNPNSPNVIVQSLPEDIPGAYNEGVAYHPDCYYQVSFSLS